MAEASEPGFAAKNASRASAFGLTIVIIGALVAAAAGPLQKTGLYDFSGAFAVLRYAVYGLGVGAAICLIGFILGLIAYKSDVLSHAANGLLGIIIAGAVFLVPYSQMSRNAPPIHEVTTDFENPPAFVDVVPLRAETNAANPPEFVPVVEGFGRKVDVIALQKEHYPDIQPVTLEGTNYEAAFEKALKGVEDMGWTLVSSNPESGRIEAYDTTTWMGFVDDVVIRVEAVPVGHQVDIRSKSRVGFGDVGANAARVRSYLRKVGGA